MFRPGIVSDQLQGSQYYGCDCESVIVQFYSDTVMEMARRQFVAGSPLRTLSLLLAGQPAEVFAVPPVQTGNFMDGASAANNSSQVQSFSNIPGFFVSYA